MMKESGQSHFERFEDIPEIEEGLVAPWREPQPPKPQKIDFHRDPRIQHDIYIEDLQDRADEVRMCPDWLPQPINHENGGSWLQILKEKVWKKSQQ